MSTTIMMAATVAILNCTVKILLYDFIDVYCRCASMKLNANLMQQIHGTHAKTTAQDLISPMLQNEPYHCSMRMFRCLHHFLFLYFSLVVNRDERHLRCLAEVRPQLAIVCWNRYFLFSCNGSWHRPSCPSQASICLPVAFSLLIICDLT